jgi:putative NADH-flavin reductase
LFQQSVNKKGLVMKIAVFGGSGTVGLRLLQVALERGFEVKALVRTPEKLGELQDKIEIIKGDYFDKEMILKTIGDTTAILSTLGPPLGRNHSVKPEDYGNAMQNLIQCMKEVGISRLISLSSMTTSYKEEPITLLRKLFRAFFSIIAPVMIPGKEKELEVLMNSDINWTNLRPPVITDNVKGELHANEYKSMKMGWKVNTDQLVNFMLDSIHSETWVKKAPFVVTK